jgi:hypothetical protein
MKLVAFLTILVLMGLGAAQCDEPRPLGVTSRTIGGGALNEYTPGVANGVGLNNIGLLVRMWGMVTFKDDDDKYFYIDDGQGREDGSGQKGVRVSYNDLADNESFTPPSQVGNYVAVTGISSTWVNTSDQVQPLLRPRRGADMQTY